MNIHLLQHESFESPAAIEQWIKENGHQATFTRFYLFELLPENIDAIDLLLIMGGPQSPSTTKAECPHFDGKAEIAFIKKVIDAHKKVLGICLGAQLIGEAMGAKTAHSPHREIGNYEIRLTDKAKNDPVTSLLPEVVVVGHWHGDMPGLTAASEILASSEGCPRQIVRYSSHVYGLQCHLEFNTEAIEGMITNNSEEIQLYASEPFVQSADQLRAHNYEPMNKWLYVLLDKLINIA